MSKRDNGFTLVEILIVIVIVAIMALILMGILNPIALINKAGDAQRKRDLDVIKKSFEEYFNDKGQYPIDVASWNIKSNCKQSVTGFKYLAIWPCDPNGQPYDIVVDGSGKWFKVLTNLLNKKDTSIPTGWYDSGYIYVYEGVDTSKVNYGVSSPNINWYEKTIDSTCQALKDNNNCYKWLNGACNSSTNNSCGDGYDCYLTNDCTSCKVECCGVGCDQ